MDYLGENSKYGNLAQHYLECVLDSAPLASNLNGGWEGIWADAHGEMLGVNPDDDFDFNIMNSQENEPGSNSTASRGDSRGEINCFWFVLLRGILHHWQDPVLLACLLRGILHSLKGNFIWLHGSGPVILINCSIYTIYLLSSRSFVYHFLHM